MSGPQGLRRAVIDVGTNSVKVLVADVAGGVVTPLWETSEQTRLGRGFYETRRLQAEPIAATAAAVARFAEQARGRGAGSVRVVATSAARDAVNAVELIQAIQGASGLAVEVISGGHEAELGFRGVASATGFQGRRLLILDVGGGSTEFMTGRNGVCEFRRSYALGSVRLQERFPPRDPPAAGELGDVRAWLRDFLEREVAGDLRPVLTAQGLPECVVGVGGTTLILALMQHGRREVERELLEGTTFSQAQLSLVVEHLWSLPLEFRRQLAGLPPERADVILFGAAIHEAILRTFNLIELGVSTRGLRFAALTEPSKGTPAWGWNR